MLQKPGCGKSEKEGAEVDVGHVAPQLYIDVLPSLQAAYPNIMPVNKLLGKFSP